MKRIALTCMVLFLVVAILPARADSRRRNPEWRFPSVVMMRNSTSSADISSSNVWITGANTSQYTDSFELEGAETREMGVFISVTEVNSGTHVLYLQGSNLGGSTAGNWANITEVSPVEASVSSSLPVFTRQTRAKVSIDATGDYALIYRDLPRFKYYRFHMDADASAGPIKVDQFNICRY